MPLRPIVPLGVAVVLLSGCSSVAITPAAVRQAVASASPTGDSFHRWENAVLIANAFLDSPFRRTLPAGRLVFDDHGMLFSTAAGTWPVRVRYDPIGQVCVTLGFAAQERVDGFAVGKIQNGTSPFTDNTFFLTRSGKTQSPEAIAALILHELTHVVLRDGTVSVPKAIAYYAEAMVTFRTRTLTPERRPYATSEEFLFFLKSHGADTEKKAKLLREFEEHLALGPTKFCRHGPFVTPVAPMPLSRADAAGAP